MASITAIRNGIATNLAVLPDIQVEPYMLANPTPPAAHVKPGETLYDRTMGRGLDELTFKVQVFLPMIVDVASQQNLDQYLAGSGSLSVKTAIESDKTLGGIVQDTHVTMCSEPMLYRHADGKSSLMCEWTVQVFGTN